MDQAEPYRAPGPPERAGEPGRPDAHGAEAPGHDAPGPDAPGPDAPGPEALGQARAPGLAGGYSELVHPVVAGFDGSSSSRHALAYAAGLARRLERPLLVVYVTPPVTYCEPLTGHVIGMVRDDEEIGRWLAAELEQVCDTSGLQVRAITRCGTPARSLAAVAAECGADALVIGASSQAWHHLAGSVPGWLARHVQCPVTVVP